MKMDSEWYKLKAKKRNTSEQFIVPSWKTYDILAGDDAEEEPNLTAKREANRKLLDTHITARYQPRDCDLDFVEHMQAGMCAHIISYISCEYDMVYVYVIYHVSSIILSYIWHI